MTIPLIVTTTHLIFVSDGWHICDRNRSLFPEHLDSCALPSSAYSPAIIFMRIFGRLFCVPYWRNECFLSFLSDRFWFVVTLFFVVWKLFPRCLHVCQLSMHWECHPLHTGAGDAFLMLCRLCFCSFCMHRGCSSPCTGRVSCFPNVACMHVHVWYTDFVKIYGLWYLDFDVLFLSNWNLDRFDVDDLCMFNGSLLMLFLELIIFECGIT